MEPFDFSTGTTNPETFPTEALAEAAARRRLLAHPGRRPVNEPIAGGP